MYIVELGVEFYASDNIRPTQNHSISVSLVFLVIILAVAGWEAHRLTGCPCDMREMGLPRGLARCWDSMTRVCEGFSYTFIRRIYL